jgi:4-aminobutyrate aminotransferase/(S)-3-amino-2-methylpropionate transaminase
MRELDLAGAARRIGEVMDGRLRSIAERDPRIAEVRGRGAMVAVEITAPGTLTPDPAATAAVSVACHRAGLLTLTCGTYGNVLRFLPPLVIDEPTLGRALDILDEAFAAV